ncbi:hypothetical protein BJX66DRAFT_311791 [Aspergillus keveii]|uniref:C2H2-type domain-containing protein n=1 Tax=Aspergillus keveii TaxID=714993 RepID=A0ABR4FUQ5_9EURO
MVTDSIAHTLNECLRNFAALTASDDLARYEAEVSRQRWLDELGRLRIWSGNIGAHQQGQSSLDHRLRDASHLKSETIKLLNRMLGLLEDVRDIVRHTGDGDDIEMKVEFEDDDESDNTTELQQVYQAVVPVINLLFLISMAIRNPAAHDRLLHMKVKEESHFEFSYQQHVSHKYPSLSNEICARLGCAMAQQRSILKYRERHRAKLGQGLSEHTETESTGLSATEATELAPGTGQLLFLETISDSGLTQTSYATSLMAAQDNISIPDPPKESKDRGKFECPYCFYIITIKTRKDWSRHVFRDLMPYVCLAKDCATPTKPYESRREWYYHMCEAHALGTAGKEDICPMCQVAVTSFDRHVGRHLEELSLFVLPRTDAPEDSLASWGNIVHFESHQDNSPHISPDSPRYGASGEEAQIEMGDWSSGESERSHEIYNRESPDLFTNRPGELFGTQKRSDESRKLEQGDQDSEDRLFTGSVEGGISTSHWINPAEVLSSPGTYLQELMEEHGSPGEPLGIGSATDPHAGTQPLDPHLVTSDEDRISDDTQSTVEVRLAVLPDEVGVDEWPANVTESRPKCHRWECSLCGEVFVERSILEDHLPSHEGVKVFYCKEPGCNQSFKRQEHLKRHMKSHSKQVPYVCWVPGCHRAFGRSDSLNAHYTKAHGKRGGRNRYVATLDDQSPDYDPDFQGQLTPDGRPIYGSKLDDLMPGAGEVRVGQDF